jgi:methionyl-tRNA formyltransferase
LKITILSSSANHPVDDWLETWANKNSGEHDVEKVHSKEHLTGGDVLFLISCSDIIAKEYREKYKKTLVIHASDLPKGRGWSPHVWEIINGADKIVLSLLEANDSVDTGDIWKKVTINIPKDALYDEINQILFEAEIKLMDFAVENFNKIKPAKQKDTECSYWPKRTPDDSQLDAYKSIAEQFNLLRVCDPKRFPAYFYLDGNKYIVKIEKVNE